MKITFFKPLEEDSLGLFGINGSDNWLAFTFSKNRLSITIFKSEYYLYVML